MSDEFCPSIWKTAANGLVVPRNIHDFEVVNVAMNSNQVEITLNYAGFHHKSEFVNASTIRIILDSPTFFSFISHHLQNVVGSMYIYEGERVEIDRFEGISATINCRAIMSL